MDLALMGYIGTPDHLATVCLNNADLTSPTTIFWGAAKTDTTPRSRDCNPVAMASLFSYVFNRRKWGHVTMDQHDLRAAFNTARGAGRRLGKDAAEKVRKQAEDAGIDIDKLEQSSRAKKAEAVDKAGEVADKIAEDPRGKTFSATMGKLGRRLAGVPVLSIPTDTIQAKYDLRERVELLAAEPQSLEELIWTATAVRQVECGLLRFRRFRAVSAGVRVLALDPTAAAVQLSARLAGRLSSGQAPPPVETLLRSAFVIAIGRIREEPTDSAAHYGLSRIYLLTDDPEPAALSARAAVRTTAAPTVRGDAFTALAFAQLSCGHKEVAQRAAEQAIANGVSTGHLVLAELNEIDEGSMADQSNLAAEHRRSVTDEDFVRYFGSRPSASSVARNVWRQQMEKAQSLRQEAKEACDAHLKSESPAQTGDNDA